MRSELKWRAFCPLVDELGVQNTGCVVDSELHCSKYDLCDFRDSDTLDMYFECLVAVVVNNEIDASKDEPHDLCDLDKLDVVEVVVDNKLDCS